MKDDVSLTQRIKAMSKKSAGIAYDLPRETVMKDRENRLARYDIGSRSQEKGTDKVIMLLGSTGTGKIAGAWVLA